MRDESRDRGRRSRGHAGGREAGQSLLEIALVTPLVLALALGVIELGRYAYIAILVGSAARAGAAYGAQTLADSVATTAIQTAADNDFQNNGQNVSTLTVTPTVTCGCDSIGTLHGLGSACSSAEGNSNAGICSSGHWVVMVSVEAKGTFSSLFNYPGIPKSITVDRTATMRVAQQ
jgi:Flp pilus assembly protein TadG